MARLLTPWDDKQRVVAFQFTSVYFTSSVIIFQIKTKLHKCLNRYMSTDSFDIQLVILTEIIIKMLNT